MAAWGATMPLWALVRNTSLRVWCADTADWAVRNATCVKQGLPYFCDCLLLPGRLPACTAGVWRASRRKMPAHAQPDADAQSSAAEPLLSHVSRTERGWRVAASGAERDRACRVFPGTQVATSSASNALRATPPCDVPARSRPLRDSPNSGASLSLSHGRKRGC